MAKPRYPKRKRETDFWFGPIDVAGVGVCMLCWHMLLYPPVSYLGALIFLFLAMILAKDA